MPALLQGRLDFLQLFSFYLFLSAGIVNTRTSLVMQPTISPVKLNCPLVMYSWPRKNLCCLKRFLLSSVSTVGDALSPRMNKKTEQKEATEIFFFFLADLVVVATT